MSDENMVNHPDRYSPNVFGVECVAPVMKANGNLGSALKCVCSGVGGGRVEDLDKALGFLRREFHRRRRLYEGLCPVGWWWVCDVFLWGLDVVTGWWGVDRRVRVALRVRAGGDEVVEMVQSLLRASCHRLGVDVVREAYDSVWDYRNLLRHS